MPPKISVIIPVYNAQDNLKKCVISLLKQTEKNFEVIFSDDGSTDESGKICDELAGKERRFKVIHNQNRGVSAARNAGLDEAKGKYVYFCDSDDALFPDTLKALFSAAEKFSADIVIAGYESFEISNKSIAKHGCEYEAGKKLDKAYINSKILKDVYFGKAGSIAPVWNKLFVREIIEKNSLSFDTRYSHGEDWAFVIDYLESSESAAVIDDIVYSYYLDGSQGYKKYKKGLGFSLVDGHRRCKELLDKNYFECTENETAAFEIRFFFQSMDYMLVCENDAERKEYCSDEQVKACFCAVLAMSSEQLAAGGASRRDKLTAVLMKKGLYHQAMKLYKKYTLKQ